MNTPPPALDQKAIIKDLFKKHGKLTAGEQWNLVSFKWYKLWKDYVGYDANDDNTVPSSSNAQVGPIDNSDLEVTVAGNTRLKANLLEQTDYVLLPVNVWEMLHSWYGGGPAITRTVILNGHNKVATVEVYRLRIKLLNTKTDGTLNISSEVEMEVSKTETVQDLKSKGCELMELNPEHVRLWNSFTSKSSGWGKEMKDSAKTLEDATIVDGQKIIFEVQLDDGTWPKQKKDQAGHQSLFKRGLNYLFGHHEEADDDDDDHNREEKVKEGQPGDFPKGLCGLHNLGNTCFMNSALQCLSNTVPLTEHFNSGKYKSEINKNNPLGMKGQIAEQYGKLIKDLWSGSATAIGPKNFKLILGKWAPQFSGFQQQDSQELLSFLLDGLHEDLNRVQKKPYIEEKDDETQRPDSDIAAELWEKHLKRNRSVIVDLFQGQLKSTLICPECKKVSVTFDPFMYLSLPLPIPQTKSIDVLLVRYNRTNAADEPYTMRYSVTVRKQGTIEDVKPILGQMCNIAPKNLALADVYADRIYTFLSDTRPVSGIREKDLTLAYELPTVEDDDATVRIHLLNRKPNPVVDTAPSVYAQRSNVVLFGLPLLLIISLKKVTARELYEMVWERVKRHVNPGSAKRKREEMKAKEKEDKDEKEKGKDKKKEQPPKKDNKDKEKEKNNKDTKENGKEGEAKEAKETKEPKETKEANPKRVSKTPAYPFVLKIVSSYGHTCGRCGVGSSCTGCAIECNDTLLNETNLKTVKGTCVGMGTTVGHRPTNVSTTTTASTGTNGASTNGASMNGKAGLPGGNETSVPANTKGNVGVPPTSTTGATNGAGNGANKGAGNGGSTTTAANAEGASNTTASATAAAGNTAGVRNIMTLRPGETYHSPYTPIPVKYDWRDMAITICVDWLPEVLENDFDTDTMTVKNHESVVTNAEQTRKDQLTLADCMRLFTTNEKLGPDDPWYCPKCKEHRQAWKKFDIWNTPPILVVHLKRFQYDRFSRDKLNTMIDFPIHGLDLSPFVLNKDGPPPIYDLFAISNHSGGLGGGHYTAYAKNTNGSWYLFNDNVCQRVEENVIKSPSAYVLFYQIRDLEKYYTPRL